jgi:hypothetical protein
MTTLSAIPIREPFIDLILKDLKNWEIRSKFTKKIGPVALIRSGSGTVVATAWIKRIIRLPAIGFGRPPYTIINQLNEMV